MLNLKAMLVVLTVFLSLTAQANSKISAEDLADLQQELAKVVETQSANKPGIAVKVRYQGKELFSAVKGAASSTRSLSADTPFRIASISKPFTAIAIMQLWQQGKVKLDESVTAYIPKLASTWQSVTIEHLLSHRVSVSHDLFADKYLAKANQSTNQSLIEFVNQASNKIKLLPANKASYCNSCYVLLADVVASASGLPFSQYMKSNIFIPAGMLNSAIVDSEKAIPDDLALNYAKSTEFFGIQQYTTGAMAQVSSLNDLAHFVRALKAGNLVKHSTLQLMTRVHSELGDDGAYGYGWTIGWGDNPFFSHGGDQDGYRGELFFDPKYDVEVMILTNGGDDTFKLQRRIMLAVTKVFKQPD